MCCRVQKEEKSDDSSHKNDQDPKDSHIKQRLSYETFQKQNKKSCSRTRSDIQRRCFCPQCFCGELHFPGALVSDDLVRDPVKDVKDQEHQRERRPGYRVDPLRSVHKLLPVYFRVLRLLDRVARGTFDRRAVVAGKASVL